MDFVKAETDADDDTGTASADSHYERIDIKQEVDPISIPFPSVKLESEVSFVFLGRNISQT
jgi:hypothetical protein